VRGKTNRASWRLTIKNYDTTDIMQLSSMSWIIIRMNRGKCGGNSDGEIESYGRNAPVADRDGERLPSAVLFEKTREGD